MALIGRDPGRSAEATAFTVRLSKWEWDLLRALPARLDVLLRDPARAPRLVDRLFPPARPDDPEAEAEHRRLVGDMLVTERLETLKAFAATLERPRKKLAKVHVVLDLQGLRVWLHVVNDLRVLLGTALDIRDNEWERLGPPDPETAPDWHLLVYLTDLEARILEALGAR